MRGEGIAADDPHFQCMTFRS